MEVDASIYRSPKRKRDQQTSTTTTTRYPSLVTSGLSQRLSTPTDIADELGSHSPSTRVTGKFQKLDLRCSVDLGPSLLSYSPSEEVQQLDVTSSSTAAHPPEPIPLQPQFKPPEAAEFSFESPVRGTVAPSSSSSSSPPVPVSVPVPALGRTKSSPPPSSVASDQFWHASEITGWSPDDPDEDNYGINGVGYAKPAGKAWAISQKRKQQIADYRSRETREARQRRHERRLSGFNSRRGSPKAAGAAAAAGSRSEGGSQNGDGSEERGSAVVERKAVRFVQSEDG